RSGHQHYPRLARSRLPRYYPYLRGNRLGGQSQSSRPVRGGACFGHYALARKCRPVSLLRSLWRLSHVALISARAQQNQSYADSAPHNQMRHIICAFRRLALIWASVATWGLSAFFHIGVGGRGARSLRTEHAEQEIDDFRPVVRRDRGAPARHLVHFALPLRAGEVLPRDHVLAVAAHACLLHLIRERWDIGGGRLWRQSGRAASH